MEDLTRTQIVMYAGASGDFDPLHHDEPYLRHRGFPGVFAHGMLTMGIAGRAVTDLVGDGRLVHYGARMVRQVWPGDTLTATLEARALGWPQDGPVVLLDVNVVNQHGQTVLAGRAVARVDTEDAGATLVDRVQPQVPHQSDR